ncbi:uncharacterized protein B0I36DRAFT_112721 [Microdochium trichocladiopsis]|uniref:Uncharacterized protein n=1 Tax=Microdochium trichocladiopsis TaxID=1682393 RepID=A0A9P9BTP3_9PEZI|nr:uncharacterized protein B0I36DRAFT_112721 [Microdochium trichocladiopsis]KAH7030664.1 hypothetical protein B0I36DRAFT_112721 [Microdochium trichocladiopsis]
MRTTASMMGLLDGLTNIKDHTLSPMNLHHVAVNNNTISSTSPQTSHFHSTAAAYASIPRRPQKPRQPLLSDKLSVNMSDKIKAAYGHLKGGTSSKHSGSRVYTSTQELDEAKQSFESLASTLNASQRGNKDASPKYKKSDDMYRWGFVPKMQ